MKTKEKYERMLNNASDIQYILNLAEGFDYEWNYALLNEPFISHNKVVAPYTLQYVGQNGWEFYPLKKWEYKFLLKGRLLRAGLATPMARYYGYKAIM